MILKAKDQVRSAFKTAKQLKWMNKAVGNAIANDILEIFGYEYHQIIDKKQGFLPIQILRYLRTQDILIIFKIQNKQTNVSLPLRTSWQSCGFPLIFHFRWPLTFDSPLLYAQHLYLQPLLAAISTTESRSKSFINVISEQMVKTLTSALF